MIVNSPLQLVHISLKISYKNLVLEEENEFNLISLGIHISCLPDDIWIL